MFNRLTLKKKIIYSTAVALFLLAAVGGTSAFLSAADRMKTSLDREIANTMDAYGEYVGSWLKSKGNALTSLPSDAGKAYMVSHLKQVSDAAGFDNVFLAYPDGSQQNANGVVLPPGNDDPRKWGWYINAMKDPSSVFMDNPTVAAATGANVVSLGKAIDLQGEQVVLGADVELSDIVDNQEKLTLPGEGIIFLANAEGNIFAHQDGKLLNKSVSEIGISPSDLKTASSESRGIPVNIRGHESKLYVAPIAGTELSTVVAINYDSMMAPLTNRVALMVIAVLLLVLVFIFVMGIFINVLFRPLLTVSDALAAIAEGGGDLTQRIPITSHDEVGTLATSFNQFLDSQQQLISHIRSQSEDLTREANEAAERSNRMVGELNQQQSEISMVATAVTEMASAAQEIASNAEQTAHSAQESTSSADNGRQIVLNTKGSIHNLAEEITQASNVINELNQHVQEISTILTNIQGVAEQTNLLALNAAIEAARAGEQGRGFAVVADEVRVLSQRTHKSTEEIQTMIDTLHQTMVRAVDLMANSSNLAHKSVGDADDAAASLEEINRSIALISDMATQIATAVEEQTHVTGEITQNVTSIKDVSDALTEHAGEGLTGSQRLNEQAASLNGKVETFKV